MIHFFAIASLLVAEGKTNFISDSSGVVKKGFGMWRVEIMLLRRPK